MIRRRTYLALLFIWVAFTFLLTSVPHTRVDVPLPYADKIAHFCFYGVMGFLCALWRRASGSPPGRAALVALLFTAFVGAVDEAHQHWIPGRSTEFFDWIADAAGGGAGALFSVFVPLLLPFLLTE